MTVAAYLRRSVSRDPSREVSREAQEAACRRLAGSDDVELYIDWGISGGTAKRPEYQRLRADVEAGKVSAVVCYSLSRLGRQVRELLAFLELCRERGVTVTTEAEGAIGGKGAFGNFVVLLLAGIAELERELAAERTLAGLAAWREKHPERFLGNVHFGDRPGEDAAAVVAAFREAGSYHGAARLLNERGVPSRLGRPWGMSAVRNIVEHRAPELPRRRPGRIPATPYALSGLLVCPHDGSRLAGKRNHGRWIGWSCRKAPERPGHPRPWSVSEAYILPAVRDELARLRLPFEAVQVDGVDLTAQRAALVEERRRLALTFAAGALDEATWSDEDDRVAAKLDELTARVEAATVIPVEPLTAEQWEAAPAEVRNRSARALWREIRLGPDLRPTPEGFAWRVPEWRRS